MSEESRRKLDAALVKYVGALEEYKDRALEAEGHMRQGYLKLTKAELGYGIIPGSAPKVSPLFYLALDSSSACWRIKKGRLAERESDPIGHFGFLSSNLLKSARTHFVNAVEAYIELAGQAQKIRAIENELIFYR